MRYYLKQWQIPGSKGDTWTVSLDQNARFSCSCPAWRFRRLECRHILIAKSGMAELGNSESKPEYVLAKVQKPIYVPEKNQLLIPLLRLPDLQMMEVTIVFYLLQYGYSWQEIRNLRRNIPSAWSPQRVIAYIQENGEACYPDDHHQLQAG